MRTVIFTDFRCKIKNGNVYASQQACTVIARYTEKFGEITLCSRLLADDNITEKDFKLDNINKFVAINGLLKTILGLNDKKILNEINKSDLILLRLPAFIAIRAGMLNKSKKCFSECMADPWDGLWNHGIAGKLIAPYIFFEMKKVVKKSDFTLYVTQSFLQKRYPCNNITVGVSDVVINDITDDYVQSKIKKYENCEKNREFKLMTTAAVNVKYKGQQFVIKAIARLKKKGINVKYILVGGGDNSYLKKLASRNDVLDLVEFKGILNRDEIFNLLDTVDAYIQPSLQEGLPRALVEAMSRGCICIGAKTGGIPELLPKELIVRKRNINDLEKVITKIMVMKESEKIDYGLKMMNVAKLFEADVLNLRRDVFFNKILGCFK